MLSFVKKIIWFIIVLFVVWFIWHLSYLHALTPVDAKSAARISVTIASGTSGPAIAQELEDKGVIRSSSAFLYFAKKSGKSSSLQAGKFVLQPSMTVEQVIDALVTGQTQEESVTVPEGFTVKDLDTLLTEKGLIESGALIHCASACDFSTFDFLPSGAKEASRGGKLEGYLYPDTYFVDPSDFVVKFFVERMLGTFRTKVVNGLADDITGSKRSLHDIVTMASLIEEETRTGAERPVVAGILWKRYDENMGLYVDASNRYILDKPTEAITASDLDMDSPYNLRKYRGLPPGPIANPGLSSIKAALHPDASPYYYYLHGSDGVIHYAITNEEHNINRAKYLK